MRADDELEAVLGAVIVPSPVGHEDGGAAHPKKAIRNHHGPVSARVPIIAHHLSAHNDSIIIRISLQHVPGQVHSNDAGAAAHAPKIVTYDIPSHFVMVYYHR